VHEVLAEIDVDCLHHDLVPCLPCPGPYSGCRWWRLAEKDENRVTDSLRISKRLGEIAVHVEEQMLDNGRLFGANLDDVRVPVEISRAHPI